MNLIHIVEFKYFTQKNPLDGKECEMCRLCIYEFGDNGFDSSHRLQIDFPTSLENLDWERHQVEHYFEYTNRPLNIITNDKNMFEKLFNDAEIKFI